MFYDLLRPLLFSMDAERAHDTALSAARFLANHPWLAELIHDHIARPATDERRIAGLTFSNPIGLAAGMDKNAIAPIAWWAFGFGFMELGTLTPLPQPGKPRPRMFRFPDRQAIVNRMGFNNGGAPQAAHELQQQKQLGLRPPCPLGLSVGMNALTPRENAPDDYRAATEALAPHADYIAINVSSPNTAGLRRLQAAAQITPIVSATRAAAGGKPLFVKIAPELGPEALAEILEACIDQGVSGVIATNTLATASMPNLPEGGLSGAPLRERALHQVSVVRKITRDRIAVIGCGGIDDPTSASRMFDAGRGLGPASIPASFTKARSSRRK